MFKAPWQWASSPLNRGETDSEEKEKNVEERNNFWVILCAVCIKGSVTFKLTEKYWKTDSSKTSTDLRARRRWSYIRWCHRKERNIHVNLLESGIIPKKEPHYVALSAADRDKSSVALWKKGSRAGLENTNLELFVYFRRYLGCSSGKGHWLILRIAAGNRAL